MIAKTLDGALSLPTASRTNHRRVEFDYDDGLLRSLDKTPLPGYTEFGIQKRKGYMATPLVEVAQRGQITIPKTVRDKNNIQEGQKYAVHDLGNGMPLLSPRKSKLIGMCNELCDALLERGATLEGMLAELRRMRESEEASNGAWNSFRTSQRANKRQRIRPV